LRTAWSVLIGVLVLAGPAAGQDSVPLPRFEPRPAVRAFAGVHVLGVPRAAVGVGLGVGNVGYHGDFGGWALIVEAGIGGGQVGLAHVMVGPFGGARLQLSVLRSWDDPRLVEEDQTFAGLEAQLTFLAIGPRVGVFKRLAGDADGDSLVFSLGLAMGY
jgi:hypothetical protein